MTTRPTITVIVEIMLTAINTLFNTSVTLDKSEIFIIETEGNFSKNSVSLNFSILSILQLINIHVGYFLQIEG